MLDVFIFSAVGFALGSFCSGGQFFYVVPEHEFVVMANDPETATPDPC